MESLLCNEVWLMSPNDDDGRESNGCSAGGRVSGSLFSLKEDCEEAFGVLVAKEGGYMPAPGYTKLVGSNDLVRSARFECVAWLIKSQRSMDLSPGTVFMAVNYLDRFISLSQCQGWKYWMLELLSIACLSVASKFNETTTRALHELPVEVLDHSFTPTLIQRMELTLMKALSWRMNSTTSFSYVHLLIQGIDALNKTLIEPPTDRITELLLSTLLDTKFLEFKPCVIAMSAVRCIFEDLFPSTNNASLAHFDTLIPQDHKDDLMKCQRIMTKLLLQDHNNMLPCGNYSWPDPSSPVTVLKVECYKSYDCPVDLTILGINFNSRSSLRKRKRKELECGL